MRLQTGWQDLFVQQTLKQYTDLHRRGLDVALTIGPWTHLETTGKGAAPMIRESLDWLAEHLAGTGSRMRWAPVRVYITGAEEWHDLPEWPPATAERVLYLRSGGVLDDQPAPAGAAPAAFTYDTADPTPTVGGRLLAPSGGFATTLSWPRGATYSPSPAPRWPLRPRGWCPLNGPSI